MALARSGATPKERPMAKAVLTISSKNYGAWALRGWLMASWPGWSSPRR
jgi:hypothetical protein